MKNNNEYKARKQIEEGYKNIINGVQSYMGYNSKYDLSNMKDSPSRCTKGFLECIWSSGEIKKKIQEAIKDFDTNFSGMIIEQNIITFSMCPHHFLPVIYRITVAYIPKEEDSEKGRVIGVSKLARIAITLSKRPVLQETLTDDIASVLAKNYTKNNKFGGLESMGSAATVEGIHLCMAMRGVQRHEGRVITSKLYGAFDNIPDTKAEYLGFIHSNRPLNIL